MVFWAYGAVTVKHKARTQALRVANIIEEGRLGGPQVRIANVARALQPEIETTVILPTENSEHFRSMLKAYEVPYRAFPLSRITKEPKIALRYIVFSWYEILQLFHYFKNEKFDLVHVSGGAWQYKGVIAGRLAGLKVVWHLNDTYMPLFIRLIFSVLSNAATGYIFAAERSYRYYHPYLNKSKPSFIIPAPVDTDYFNAFSTHNNCSQDLNDLILKNEPCFVIGTVANINPVKGLETLIEIASYVQEKNKNVFFVVVGAIFENQKKYFHKLKTLIDKLQVKNILFLGPKMDIRSCLSKFHIYLCTSIAESSPISVWEAMSMGKPIISTDVGDVPLYVQSGSCGEIFPIYDSKLASKLIIDLVDNKQRREFFGANARRVALKYLDISVCARKHIQAYTSITNTDL